MTQPPSPKASSETPVYRYLDHTADLRVEIRGHDLAALFENAGFALFDMLADSTGLSEGVEEAVTVEGEDLVDLMFNWLRALLFFWTVKGRLVVSAQIVEINETRLLARVRSDTYDANRHFLKTDIKAVTYHDLTVEQTKDDWFARVVFDV